MLKSAVTLFALCLSVVSVQGADGNSTADAQRIGYSGTLSSLDGGLGGVVSVKSATELDITGYKLADASAPALYWWGSTTNNIKSGFRISNTQIKTPTPSATDLVVTLDAGKTTADFAFVGLWCEKFEANFGQTELVKDGSSSQATPAATSAAATSASAKASESAKSQASTSNLSHVGLLACLCLAAATFVAGMI